MKPKNKKNYRPRHFKNEAAPKVRPSAPSGYEAQEPYTEPEQWDNFDIAPGEASPKVIAWKPETQPQKEPEIAAELSPYDLNGLPSQPQEDEPADSVTQPVAEEPVQEANADTPAVEAQPAAEVPAKDAEVDGPAEEAAQPDAEEAQPVVEESAEPADADEAVDEAPSQEEPQAAADASAQDAETDPDFLTGDGEFYYTDAEYDAFDTDKSKKRDKNTSGSGKKAKKHWKRALLIILAFILVLVIGLVGTFFVMREIGRNSMGNNTKVEIVTPTVDESGNDITTEDQYGRVITYNGTSYAYNNDVIALTFIGIDKGHGVDKDLKMADAIYVLAVDTKNHKVKILSVSRDTMADVDIYAIDGTFIDTENRQIAYSYAYHGDSIDSGTNTNRTVSRLMFGLPLDDYFAINLDAVATLNDAVGGVTVKSTMTFTSPENGRTISEGETVTLHGKEAEYYVQHRDITQLASNNDRMKRQQDYITAFLGSIVPAAKKDLSVITTLYNAISSNSQSSLDLPKLTYIASSALSNLNGISDVEFVKLNGEITPGEKNAELRLTNEEILSKMLDVFYEPLPAASATEPAATAATAATAAAAQ